uniref:DEP domain-containing protein 1A-like isoform X2 n=1 Tax=Myxine glutinosa TaxID=7769 RepID=UPI00358E2FF3
MRSQVDFPAPCKKHLPTKNVGNFGRAIPQRFRSPLRTQRHRTGIGEKTSVTTTTTTIKDELQEDERWKEMTLYLLSTVLERDSLWGLVDPRRVHGAHIRHNAQHVGKHGIVTLEDKTGDLPQWVLSALRSLSHLISGYLVLSKYASPPRPLAPSHRLDPWRPIPQQHPRRFRSSENCAPNALYGNGFEHELYQNGEILRQRPSRHIDVTDIRRKFYKRERSCSLVGAGDALLEVGARLNSMANATRGRSQSLSTCEVAVSSEKGHPCVIGPGHHKHSNCFNQGNIDTKASLGSHIRYGGPIPRAQSLNCIVQTSLLTTCAETSTGVHCESSTFRPKIFSARSQILPTLYGPTGITMVLVKHPTCEATALLAVQLLCLLLPP